MTSRPAGVEDDDAALLSAAESRSDAGTVYHVRLRATNSRGTDRGVDHTFTDELLPLRPRRHPRSATPAPTLPGTPAPTVLTPTTPEPVQGESVVVAPTRGTVLVKAPGGGFVPLTARRLGPGRQRRRHPRGRDHADELVGATTQTGSFRGGMFEVRQAASGNGMTDIVLRGGDFSVCKRARTAAAGKKAPTAASGARTPAAVPHARPQQRRHRARHRVGHHGDLRGNPHDGHPGRRLGPRPAPSEDGPGARRRELPGAVTSAHSRRRIVSGAWR